MCDLGLQDEGKDDITVKALWFAYCEGEMHVPLPLWIGFVLFAVLAICLDVICVKPSDLMELKISAIYSLMWLAAALGFGVIVFLVLGARESALFLTGFIVEESLSIDNLVVFVLIFQEYKTPSDRQHTALLYGVLFSIVLRVIFIFFGTWLLSKARVMLLVFGLFLVYTGGKMALGDSAQDIGMIRTKAVQALAYFGADVAPDWSGSGKKNDQLHSFD